MYVFQCHFSVFIRTIQSTFATSEFRTRPHGTSMNIGRSRSHKRVGRKQCRFQRFVDGTSLPSMHGLVNVRWRCLVIVFPDATMHMSSQYIMLKIQHQLKLLRYCQVPSVVSTLSFFGVASIVTWQVIYLTRQRWANSI